MRASHSFTSRLLKKIIDRCESVQQVRKAFFFRGGIYAEQLSWIYRPNPKLVLNSISGYLPLYCRTRL